MTLTARENALGAVISPVPPRVSRADLVLADGWPVVRTVRLLGGHRIQRVTGADLFPAVSARGE